MSQSHSRHRKVVFLVLILLEIRLNFARNSVLLAFPKTLRICLLFAEFFAKTYENDFESSSAFFMLLAFKLVETCLTCKVFELSQSTPEIKRTLIQAFLAELFLNAAHFQMLRLVLLLVAVQNLLLNIGKTDEAALGLLLELILILVDDLLEMLFLVQV